MRWHKSRAPPPDLKRRRKASAHSIIVPNLCVLIFTRGIFLVCCFRLNFQESGLEDGGEKEEALPFRTHRRNFSSVSVRSRPRLRQHTKTSGRAQTGSAVASWQTERRGCPGAAGARRAAIRQAASNPAGSDLDSGSQSRSSYAKPFEMKTDEGSPPFACYLMKPIKVCNVQNNSAAAHRGRRWAGAL